MTVDEARKRLGLGANDRLEDYLPHWKEVEVRLAKLMDEAEQPETKANYGADLASLREVMEVLEVEPQTSRGSGVLLLWLLVVGLLVGGGYYGYQRWVEPGPKLGSSGLGLEQFEQALEKRNWEEAEKLIVVFEAEGGSPKEIEDARGRIEQGKIEEKGQQIAFLVGNAQSALEAGQLSESESYCSQVEELQPGHPALPEIREQIKESKRKVRSMLMVREIEKALQEGNLKVAENQLAALLVDQPKHDAISGLQERLAVAQKEKMENQAKAGVLVAKARELDQGVYSAEALSLLEEAVRLDPSDENRALYKRMSEYGKVMRVPSEFSTIADALKDAKANDRIFVEKGTYGEALIVPEGVEIVGESRTNTIIECPAEKAAVITVGKGLKNVRIASLTLRHQGLVNDDERFSAVIVDGGRIQLEDVLISRACGHGVAVLNGGRAILSLCNITESGWDGISARGEGSNVILTKVTSEKNLQHGVDFWDGAGGQITQSQFLGNGLAGLTAIDSAEPIIISTTRSEDNREIGLFFSGVAGATVTDCDVHKNQLGGIVFEDGSKAVKILKNRVTGNGKAGIVFEKGVEILENEGNEVEKNEGHQIWNDAVFSPQPEVETITPPPPAPPAEGPVEEVPPKGSDPE